MAFVAILKYPRVESVGFFFINQFKLLNAQKAAHSITASGYIWRRMILTPNQHYNDWIYFLWNWVWSNIAEADTCQGSENEIHARDVTGLKQNWKFDYQRKDEVKMLSGEEVPAFLDR